MRKLIILLSIAILFNSGCKKDNSPDENTLNSTTFELSFTCGEALISSSAKDIYVAWVENTEEGYIQNLTICNKLIAGGLTGTALPYWKQKKYTISDNQEVDAVTAATIANTDFAFEFALKDTTLESFTIFFEIDHSFDGNDWFSDQPALLYSADIDMNHLYRSYTLEPVGWTPNENTENIIDNTPMGQLQTEMGYINLKKDGNSFGEIDPKRSTLMVNEIRVTTNRNE